LGDECRADAGSELNRAPQRLAITHQLVKIGCPT
jgi:hypothetical protein